MEKIIVQFSQKVRKLDHTLSSISEQENQSTEVNANGLVMLGNYYFEAELFEKAIYMYYHYMKENSNGPDIEAVKASFEKCKPQLMEADKVIKNFEAGSDAMSTAATYDAEQVIFAEGMVGDRMFFLQSGSVRICKVVNGKEIALAVLYKGELFGEMALLESKPRSATAIAASNCSLIVITHQNFSAVVRRDPSLITRITTVLANRIWFVYRQIANIILSEGPDRFFDALLLFMEKKGLEKCLTQQNIGLDVTPKDMMHFIGMDAKKAKDTLSLFVKERIITITNDKIIVNNPQYVNNRAAHIRDQYEMGISRSDDKK